jgi:hypothetical protein
MSNTAGSTVQATATHATQLGAFTRRGSRHSSRVCVHCGIARLVQPYVRAPQLLQYFRATQLLQYFRAPRLLQYFRATHERQHLAACRSQALTACRTCANSVVRMAVMGSWCSCFLTSFRVAFLPTMVVYLHPGYKGVSTSAWPAVPHSHTTSTSVPKRHIAGLQQHRPPGPAHNFVAVIVPQHICH